MWHNIVPRDMRHMLHDTLACYHASLCLCQSTKMYLAVAGQPQQCEQWRKQSQSRHFCCGLFCFLHSMHSLGYFTYNTCLPETIKNIKFNWIDWHVSFLSTNPFNFLIIGHNSTKISGHLFCFPFYWQNRSLKSLIIKLILINWRHT